MLKNYVKLIIAILFVSNVMAQNIPSYVPKDGLVGWWPFNGNANDESGNGNHGTVNGATLTTDRDGVANSAYSFDGKSFIECKSNNSSLKYYTLSFWLKNDVSNNDLMSIISYEINSGNIQKGYVANISNMFLSGGNNGTGQNSKFKIDNTWNFYSIKYDGQSLTFFKNNQLESTTYNTTPIEFLINVYFGKTTAYWAGPCYLFGQLDDIAIYNRALSDQEIKQLYKGCTKETATSSSFNSVVYTTNTPVNLNATPSGGTFNGEAVANNTFNPSKAKFGKNQVKYNFKNSTGCADSTNFTMILVDTLGNKCSTYDTLKIKVKLTTGIKAGQLTSMNIYPNPTSDKLIIEANDIQALSGYKYKIVDLQGKEVYNALATTAKTEISLKSIGVKGMYILHVLDAQGVSIENKKIVLE